MKKWVVYMVRCRDGTLYTGMTNDLVLRLQKHNSGKGAKYTRSRLPVQPVWQERQKSETAARKREAAVKKLSRQSKLALIA